MFKAIMNNFRYRHLHFFILLLFLIIPAILSAQDFTAKSIGDYGNVTVMEVTGNLFSGGANRQMNQYLRYSSLAVFRIILSILIIVWN